MNDLGNIDET